MNVRTTERAERTAYIEHGVWYEKGRIHITISGANLGAHRSIPVTDPWYAKYERILRDVDRWPAGARSALENVQLKLEAK